MWYNRDDKHSQCLLVYPAHMPMLIMIITSATRKREHILMQAEMGQIVFLF